ncbi:MAG: Nif11-like leader peptide family natural product precursor [Gemmatimonadota bacterium]|nr:MAG: Nif11-like leader peptide family natural product precursor [Gemmatimonadota bacterium]
MSREMVAAFFREANRNPVLRQELAALAANHGFAFGPDELSELDFTELKPTAARPGTEAFMSSAVEDDESDPGFGIIEIPA